MIPYRWGRSEAYQGEIVSKKNEKCHVEKNQKNMKNGESRYALDLKEKMMKKKSRKYQKSRKNPKFQKNLRNHEK